MAKKDRRSAAARTPIRPETGEPCPQPLALHVKRRRAPENDGLRKLHDLLRALVEAVHVRDSVVLNPVDLYWYRAAFEQMPPPADEKLEWPAAEIELVHGGRYDTTDLQDKVRRHPGYAPFLRCVEIGDEIERLVQAEATRLRREDASLVQDIRGWTREATRLARSVSWEVVPHAIQERHWERKKAAWLTAKKDTIKVAPKTRAARLRKKQKRLASLRPPVFVDRYEPRWHSLWNTEWVSRVDGLLERLRDVMLEGVDHEHGDTWPRKPNRIGDEKHCALVKAAKDLGKQRKGFRHGQLIRKAAQYPGADDIGTDTVGKWLRAMCKNGFLRPEGATKGMQYYLALWSPRRAT